MSICLGSGKVLIEKIENEVRQMHRVSKKDAVGCILSFTGENHVLVCVWTDLPPDLRHQLLISRCSLSFILS